MRTEQELKEDKIKKEKAKKKEEELKKKLIPIKKYFDVKVEVMLPATLTYRVLAESPQQASEMIKNLVPNSVKHKLIGKKDIKLTVYDAGSTMIKFLKNLLK